MVERLGLSRAGVQLLLGARLTTLLAAVCSCCRVLPVSSALLGACAAVLVLCSCGAVLVLLCSCCGVRAGVLVLCLCCPVLVLLCLCCWVLPASSSCC